MQSKASGDETSGLVHHLKWGKRQIAAEVAHAVNMRSSFADKKIGIIYGMLAEEDRLYWEDGLSTGDMTALSVSNVRAICRELELDVALLDPTRADFLQRVQTVDLLINCCHGAFGEDGVMQGVMELAGVPYVGPRVTACAVAISKALSKSLARDLGIAVPRECQIDDIAKWRFPVVVKPDRGGSSIGIEVFETASRFAEWRAQRDNLSGFVVEEFIKGKSVTLSLMQLGKNLIYSDVLEVGFGKSIFYDRDVKLAAGEATYKYPASLDAPVRMRLRAHAAALAQRLGVVGMCRFDFVVDAQGRGYFLEMNTNPGLGRGSNFLSCMAGIGIAQRDVILCLLRSAFLNHAMALRGRLP